MSKFFIFFLNFWFQHNLVKIEDGEGLKYIENQFHCCGATEERRDQKMEQGLCGEELKNPVRFWIIS